LPFRLDDNCACQYANGNGLWLKSIFLPHECFDANQ
jgi:hypothetical protein